MADNFELRRSMAEDWLAIEQLYRAAFPSEDLVPLVQDLLQQALEITSLVGTVSQAIVCHVIFTRCNVSDTPLNIALLGPLAVAPAWQSRGYGSSIVRSGLQQLQNDGVARVCVLGEPAYYRRFGFLPETAIEPPYSLPMEWHDAWQSIALGGDRMQARGMLLVPEPWRRPELWLPRSIIPMNIALPVCLVPVTVAGD